MPTITDFARTKSFEKSSDKDLRGSDGLPLLNADHRVPPSTESPAEDRKSSPHW